MVADLHLYNKEAVETGIRQNDFFERNKDLYFERLFEVSASNDWSGWVEFCLKGVVEEASDAAHRRANTVVNRSGEVRD